MNSKRLFEIAKYIDKSDKLIDVGCDHGYLGIYLKQNEICEDLLLTDVSLNALNVAINNIKKYNLDIKTFCTDGLRKINLDEYNTVSISGMGTYTIVEILSLIKTNKTISKLIIQSNNNLDILRREVTKLGFYLDDETTLKENDKFYVICKFLKGNKKIDDDVIDYGLLKNDKIEYFNHLINTYNSYLKNINNEEDKKSLNEKIDKLSELLEKCR